MSHKPGTLLHIRALDLVVSSRNQRTRTRTRVQEIGASLVAHGQIENLTVIPHVSRKKNAPAFEVIDGGTRLEGAQMKISAGELADTFEFLCMVADTDQAEEISVAANMHEAMHPADEFDAFKRMIDAGSSVEAVAARFGVTPATVLRRLRLANVSARLVQGYRDGELALDQLMALAISDDHDAQEQIWDRLKNKSSWERTPERLREALAAPGSVDVRKDRIARFVGLDEYEAAGGAVVRDLFSDGGGYICDVKLLKRIAANKLEAAAESLRAEGWSWVEAHESLSYSDASQYGRSQPKKRELAEDEQAELSALQARGKEIEAKNGALELLDELGRVEARIEAIEASQETYSERQMSKAGAIVSIDPSGALEVRRGLVKPADGKKKGKDLPADDGDAGPSDGDQGGEEQPTERPLSERLVTQLTAHRTAALQALVATSPSVALTLLLYAVVPQVFKALDYRHRYDAVAKISLSNNRGCGQNCAPDLEGSAAWVRMEEEIGRWEERLPGEGTDLFPWLQGLSQADQLDLLAVCVAHSLNTIEQREESAGHARAHQLAAAVGLDMADWWAPTADSYLASVTKTRRIEAVREAVGTTAADEISSMKKDAQIAAASLRLEGSRWLPALLRVPGAEPDTPAADEPDASASGRGARPGVRYTDENGNTWTGRGKRPAWVTAALDSGKTLDELIVDNTAVEA